MGAECGRSWQSKHADSHVATLFFPLADPTIGLANGYTFAGNAALLGACKVVVATQGGLTDSAKRAATSTGMGGPAMIEGGGLGRVKPEDVGPVGIHVENGD